MDVTEETQHPIWEQYLRNAWPVFPLYSFYEVNGTKLPWNTSDRIFIHSTVATNKISFVHNQTTGFFDIYDVLYNNVTNPIGFVFCVRPSTRETVIRYSTKCISITTKNVTKAKIPNYNRKVLLDKNGITALAYGSDAEVITDLPYIMKIGVD